MPGGPDEPREGFDFETFYKQRWDALRRAINRRAKSLRLDDEAIVQDTMIRARDHAGVFVSDAAAMAWCLKVANNLMTDRARRAAQSREQLHRDPFDVDPRAELGTPESNLDPEQFERLLSALPPRQAKVLRLVAEGYDRAEIAERLNTSRGSVRVLLYRARRAAVDRWSQFVAACVGLTLRSRKTQQPSVTPGTTAVASFTVASMVAVLVFPSTGSLAQTQRAAQPSVPAPSTQLAPTAPHATRQAPARPDVSRPATATSRVGHRPVTVAAHQLVPHIPTTCAPGLCVDASCSSDPRTGGDRLYLKPSGQCGYGVDENYTPVCDYVADNPAVGCARTGDPQWQIGPPPSPIAKGEPL